MIKLDVRKNGSSFRNGYLGLWTDESGARLSDEVVRERFRDKKILGLIHGYNVSDAMPAYHDIERAVASWDEYDEVFGIFWPGSRILASYLFAQRRSRRTGDLLAAALSKVATFAALDLEAHSLGCAVACDTVKEGEKLDLHVRQVVLTAAAIRANCFNVNEEFDRVPLLTNALVAYSKHDPALGVGFILANLGQPALGQVGPMVFDRALPIALIDCSATIRDHGRYRYDQDFLRFWKTQCAMCELPAEPEEGDD